MIDIKNLDLSIRGRNILNGISASFNDGETVGIIGKSGSGKTLLLKSIAGLTGRFPRSIAVNRAPLPHRKSEARKQIRYCGAGIPLNPDEGLYDFLLHARVPYKKPFRSYSDYDRQIADEYINLLGLSTSRDSALGLLPDGIFRLAMLAHTFISEAHAIALDNPTNDLDIASVRRLKRAVGRYVMDGDHIVVISSNDLNFIAQAADRVIILDGGRVVGNGPVSILDQETIKRHFGTEVLISRNVYNGRPEFHLFPDV